MPVEITFDIKYDKQKLACKVTQDTAESAYYDYISTRTMFEENAPAPAPKATKAEKDAATAAASDDLVSNGLDAILPSAPVIAQEIAQADSQAAEALPTKTKTQAESVEAVSQPRDEKRFDVQLSNRLNEVLHIVGTIVPDFRGKHRTDLLRDIFSVKKEIPLMSTSELSSAIKLVRDTISTFTADPANRGALLYDEFAEIIFAATSETDLAARRKPFIDAGKAREFSAHDLMFKAVSALYESKMDVFEGKKTDIFDMPIVK